MLGSSVYDGEVNRERDFFLRWRRHCASSYRTGLYIFGSNLAAIWAVALYQRNGEKMTTAALMTIVGILCLLGPFFKKA